MGTTYPAVGVPPFAAPIAAPVVSLSPVSASISRVGPYVPASIRSVRPAHDQASNPTPPSVVFEPQVVGEPRPSVRPFGAAVVSGSVMDAALFGSDEEAVLPSITDFLEEPVAAEEERWVVQGAARELSALAGAFAVPPRRSGSPVSSMEMDLPPWGADDLPDVPSARSRNDDSVLVGRQPDAAPQRAQPNPRGSAEAAAHALELLALRVRAGELVLPGYDPKAGDAGALVVALAALLGIRLQHPSEQ